MKPLHVLALVVLAAGALIFAIFAGKDDSTERSAGLGPVGPETAATTTDPGDLPAPERLAPTGGGVRDVADTEQVEAAAADGRSTPGQDWANALVGSVVSPKGEPVAGAKIRLTRAVSQQLVFVGDTPDYSADRVTTSKEDGSFRFEKIEPYEAYALVAMHERFARTEVPQVAVAPEGTSQGPRIQMEAGAVLHGYVRDTGGSTVPGAKLHLDSMFQLMEDQPNPDRITTVSNAEGFYEFLNVPRGNHTLSVEADGYGYVILAGLNFTVRKGAQERDVVLEPAEMICGKVVGPGNAPVANARVIGISYSNQRQQCRDFATTDAEGKFCLEHVYAGKYTIAVNAEGFRPGREQRVEAGEANLVFQLTRQATVRGTVYALDTGKPVSNFLCELRHSYENNAATSPTEIKQEFRGTDGSFELQNVPPGNYVVQASAEGYSPTFSDPFRLTTEMMLDGVVVRLSRGGSLAGTVLDANGSPVGGARVTTHDNDYIKDLFSQAMGNMMPSNATSRTVRTSASGEFSIDGLRPETYQVRVNAPGYCELIKNGIVVIDGKPSSVGTLKLIRGGRVHGRILDPAGKGLIGADVLLRQTDQTSDVPITYETKSGAEGAYSIQNVEPGVYMISATGVPLTGGDDQVLHILGAKRSEQPVTVTNGQESRIDVKLGG